MRSFLPKCALIYGPRAPICEGFVLYTPLDHDQRNTLNVGFDATFSINALNVANRRVLLDNSLTFGGFHYDDPREIYAEVRFRFRY